MKGVNKKQFKNPMPHYGHVLNTKENFRACNQGIRAKDQSMTTYKQYKNALHHTLGAMRVVYIDNKDSFMNVRYVIRFVYRRKRDSCLYFN